MKLPPFSFAVLDTETTGFVPRVHHVIEYAAVSASGGKVERTYEQLFSVQGEVPPHVQVLTHIKPEMLAGKPTFEEKRAEIEEMLDGAELLVGQNLGFDISMLRGEGIDLTERAWVDTSMLASLVFPEFRSFSLQYMSAQLKLTHEPAHRALGDVNATLELLSHIWERLLLLPPKELAFAKEVMSKSSEGYAMLFDALPKSTSKSAPWISKKVRAPVDKKHGRVPLEAPKKGTVELREEGLSAACLQEIVNTAADDTETVRWIAVKNLEGTLKRLHIPEGLTVLHPPQLLLNPEAQKKLSEQDSYTTEEALLRLKLEWFNPRTRNDFAIHGGEKDYWNGRLACAATSPAYTSQFDAKTNAFLLDHRQLLTFLADPSHAAHGALTSDAHIIVDDASMLEDTATKAYGHFLSLDDLRAAAGEDKDLKRFTDLMALFCERVRNGLDQYFLAPADLRREEAKIMRQQAEDLLKRMDLPEKTLEQLREAFAMLDENLPAAHLGWIERRMDGALMLQSAPKHVDSMLKTHLYDKFRTTLLVPKGCNGVLPEIVPAGMPIEIDDGKDFSPCSLTVSFPVEQNLTSFLQDPPFGKTIVLAGSKRVIEQAFILHTERLEEKGVTLICQGMSGGQGRMESDFIAAQEPAILMVTPFMYEGLEFPADTADRLVLDTVPFDHPNHPVVGHRKNAYKSGFGDYCLPRTEYRLFRLMRSFCRHKKDDAQMMVFDRRLVEKEYGARLQRYMAQFASASAPIVELPPASAPGTKKKQTTKKVPAKKSTKPKERADGQMQLPL